MSNVDSNFENVMQSKLMDFFSEEKTKHAIEIEPAYLNSHFEAIKAHIGVINNHIILFRIVNKDCERLVDELGQLKESICEILRGHWDSEQKRA